MEKLNYSQRKNLARKLFGQCTIRPQEATKDYLLQRRKLNYGNGKFLEPESFQVDLARWNFAEEFLQPIELPPPTKSPHYNRVDDDTAFDEMMTTLNKERVVMVDLEGNDNDSYYGMTCMLQVGVPATAAVYLIDPFKQWKNICDKLKTYLERTDILIVMHGCGNDVKWLKRDFGIYAVGLVDSQLVYQQFHRGNNISFDNLLAKLVPSLHSEDKMKKVLQCSDWHRRPLHEKLLNYAAMDVYGLMYIWEEMKKMEDVFISIQESRKRTVNLLSASFRKEFKSFSQELSAMRKKPFLQQPEEDSAKLIWEFRNLMAKSIDINPSDLLKMNKIVDISKKRPSTVEQLSYLIGTENSYLTKSLKTIINLVNGGKEVLDKIKSITCNNCLRAGHAAFSCWETYSNENTKRFYKLHPDLKKKRNKKKHENYKRNKKEGANANKTSE